MGASCKGAEQGGAGEKLCVLGQNIITLQIKGGAMAGPLRMGMVKMWGKTR